MRWYIEDNNLVLKVELVKFGVNITAVAIKN